MRKPKPFRDPIHNYIHTTVFEQAIIDRPEFQRLRFVLQNSSAFLTYPSNLNTRFIHSLGVMHLCGKMYVRAIENADAECLEKILRSLRVITEMKLYEVQVSRKKAEAGWKLSIGDAAGFKFYGAAKELMDESGYFELTTYWQALRICSLVHDIGHLPMSHLFEDAVENVMKPGAEVLDILGEMSPAEKANTFIEYTKFVQDYEARNEEFRKKFMELDREEKGSKIRRMISHEIIGTKFFVSDVIPNYDNKEQEINEYERLLISICKLILTLSQDPEKPNDELHILRALKKMYSGVVDADRLDYCLRDPQTSGLELGAIDADRLIDNLMFVEINTGLDMAIHARAVSALESFFHQRYLMYSYLIYHHNVARLDAVIREIVERLFFEAFRSQVSREGEALAALLARMSFWERGDGGENASFLPSAKFFLFDDFWLRSLFMQVYEHLNKSDFVNLPQNQWQLFLLLETFLFRKTENLLSLWKREQDYHSSIGDYVQEISTVHAIDAHLVEQEIYYKLGGTKQRIGFNEMLKSLSGDVQAKGAVLLYKELKPKIFKSTGSDPDHFYVYQENSGTNDQVTELPDISPYIRSLETVVGRTQHFHLSFLAKDLKSNPDKCDELREMAHRRIKQYLEKIIAKATQESRS